jgi:hypothetical protein
MVVQHLYHDGAFLPILHGGAIEAEMIPQEGRGARVAAKLVMRQDLAALVAFGGRDHAAVHFDETTAASVGKRQVRQRLFADATRPRTLRQRDALSFGAMTKGVRPRLVRLDSSRDRGSHTVVGGVADLVISDEVPRADLDGAR